MADLIRHLILSTGYQCRMRSRVKPGMTGQCIMGHLLFVALLILFYSLIYYIMYCEPTPLIF